MKIKYILTSVIAILFAVTAYCQHQLYFENFEGATTTFTINDTAIASRQYMLYSENFEGATNTFTINDTAKALGPNTGNNKWIVDTNYFAGGIYPETTNEDSTYGGSISYAPYSHYLHIYDSASTYLNDNYNPADLSNRFAHMTTGVSTISMTNISFSFWYLCQGSPTAYGEVLYSINGGPWKQTGSPMYNNRYKWQYATITSPAFANVANLRFGFLWHNNSIAGKDTSALGIDNITLIALEPNKGNNKWIVNKTYTGGGIYPNTYNEDSTYGGSISFAPYGHYLHIYDSASGYVDDNYNPTDSSNRFAYMTSGICTKSLTNINFNFWYLCQGSPNAYGQVYYSINGGQWTETGSPIYNNRYKWQYATITDPVFTNVEDLRFGFRWYNDSAKGKDTSALGIDDVSIFGVYDSITHPIKCTFTTIAADSCLGGSEYVFIESTLSDSTCNSQWNVYMSPGGYGWYGYVGPAYFNDINSYWYLVPPSGFATVGHCYKFKFERTSYPYLTFTDSVCFPFDSCPGTITTLQPPATLDTNAVCAGSVIDIPFFSSGIYDVYNTYFAQLIDSVGSTAIIDTIGALASNVAYPYPPGDVVSTIPLTTPAGCHYYVRVVCNTGNRKPSMWGPFCIQHCDILTDTMASVTECMKSCKKQPKGDSVKIKFSIHQYDSLAHYYKGNKFSVQLIQFMLFPASFSAINTGLLGVRFDTTTGYMYLHVPCPDTLTAHGINPGVYYIRFVADSSSFPDSSLGSLVQLTIGEPADSIFLTVSPPGGPYCSGATITFNTNPDHQGPPYNSTYSWWETTRAGTAPFASWNQGYLGLTVTGADTFRIECQENNYGCTGPKTILPDTIIVLGAPSIVRTGPSKICVGDTGLFSVPFANNTNYSWKISSNKVHTDTANNVLKILFDTVGTVRISVVVFNACFTDSAVWTVKIVTPPAYSINANPSTTLCDGATLTLTASGGTSYKWNTGPTSAAITVTPAKDTSYIVQIKSATCKVYDTAKIKILPTPTVTVSPASSTICFGDTVKLTASGAQSYAWSPTAGLNVDTGRIVMATPTVNTTYMVKGRGADGCADSAYSAVTVNFTSGTVSSAVAITVGESVTLSATGGGTYSWSTGATTADIIVSPATTTLYTVVVTDSVTNCKAIDTVTVEVNPKCGAIFVPDAFTPGSENGMNKILYVRNNCIKEIDFIVYDRWGNKIFESTDPTKGWDGTYNGKPENTGTYAYYVNVLTFDNQMLTKKGNVALIR